MAGKSTRYSKSKKSKIREISHHPTNSKKPLSPVTDKKSNDVLSQWVKICTKINSALDIDQILDNLVMESISLCNAESGCSGLYTSDKMQIKKYFYKSKSIPLEYSWSPGQGFPGWLILHKEPYLSNHIIIGSQILKEMPSEFKIQSIISIPILNRDQELIGFFQIHNKKDTSGFTTQDLDLLTNLSQLVSNNLQNLLTHQNIKYIEQKLLHEYKFIQLLHDITLESHKIQSIEQLFQMIVDKICNSTGWPIGHVLIHMKDNGHRLKSTSIWHMEQPEKYKTLQQISESIIFSRGIGLPGEILISKKPLMINDINQEINFPRSHILQKLEIQATFAFPVLVGSDVEAVLEFFTPAFQQEDKILIEVMKSIGIQLGRIIERKKVEKKYRQAEERFRLLVEGVKNYAIYMLDPSGYIISWNKGAEHLKGYKEEDILGKHFSTFYTLQDIQNELPQKMLDNAKKLGKFEVEGWRVKNDGTKFWASVLITALYDESGSQIGFVKITRDFTERKRIEQSLRDNEKRLSEAQELAHLGSWEWDIRTNIIHWSDEMYRVFGYSPNEIKINFEKYIELVYPEDRELTHQIIESSFKTHQPFNFYHRTIRPDGNIRLLHCSGELVLDELGNPIKMFGTGQDITDMKKTEQTLRETEERFKLVSRATNDVVWDWNLTTNEIWWGERFQSLFGYSKDEIEPTVDSWYNRLHPDERESIIQGILYEIKRGEKYWSAEYRFRRADGSYAFIFDRGYVIHDESSKPIRMVGSMMDITKRKEVEEKINNYQKQLQTLASQLALTEERERRRIATELHDNLSQSLAMMRIKLDQLKELNLPTKLVIELRDFRKQLDEAIQYTRSLTFELSLPILYELSFSSALEWLAEQFQLKYKFKIDFQSDSIEKPIDEEIKIILFRTVRELFMNIAKHANAKNVILCVTKLNEDIQITVTDDGIGFDPSKLDKISQNGFGLFSIQERLNYLGGSIDFKTSPGQGTTVILVAPLQKTNSLLVQ